MPHRAAALLSSLTLAAKIEATQQFYRGPNRDNPVSILTLFGSTLGFDHVFDLLQAAARVEQRDDRFPTYDIELTDKDAYRIVLAVAGFGYEDLTISADSNLLTIEGKRAAADQSGEQRDRASRHWRNSELECLLECPSARLMTQKFISE